VRCFRGSTNCSHSRSAPMAGAGVSLADSCALCERRGWLKHLSVHRTLSHDGRQCIHLRLRWDAECHVCRRVDSGKPWRMRSGPRERALSTRWCGGCREWSPLTARRAVERSCAPQDRPGQQRRDAWMGQRRRKTCGDRASSCCGSMAIPRRERLLSPWRVARSRDPRSLLRLTAPLSLRALSHWRLAPQ